MNKNSDLTAKIYSEKIRKIRNRRIRISLIQLANLIIFYLLLTGIASSYEEFSIAIVIILSLITLKLELHKDKKSVHDEWHIGIDLSNGKDQ